MIKNTCFHGKTHFGPKACILPNPTSVMHIQDPANQRLTWNKPPVNVLVIRKIRDETLLEPFKELCRFLIQLGQTIHLQLHPHPPSTTYTCTAHNPVSKASSDSTDLEKCFTSGSQVRWVPALCASSAFFVFGALILLYKTKKQNYLKVNQFKDSPRGTTYGGECGHTDATLWKLIWAEEPTRVRTESEWKPHPLGKSEEGDDWLPLPSLRCKKRKQRRAPEG
ncbi:hypothetical protein COCON_G00090210 [Conger conger]|uniref:Uncharacterized protein n=1 Tax=Conger conger TaxID=82655 RepID=A0A9Q1DLP1_CONCO|nr:hypothetical protein COCON_G00090210 [Conger conger]